MLWASFFTGFFILVSLSLIKYWMGILDLNLAEKTPVQWGNLFFMSLVSAFIIGVIEECFFRGFIFITMREQRRLSLVTSLIVTNLFYSLIHFIGGRKPFIDQTPGFFDSLKLIYTPFLALTQWEVILPGAVGLFIFGVILSLLYLQTRSLYPCIGLHAGCVFFLKLDGSFFFQQDKNPLMLGTSHNYDGLLGWFFLLIMGIILFGIMKRFGYKFRSALALGILFLTAVPGPLQARSSWDVFFEGDQAKDKGGESGEEPSAANVLSPLSRPAEAQDNLPGSAEARENYQAPVNSVASLPQASGKRIRVDAESERNERPALKNNSEALDREPDESNIETPQTSIAPKAEKNLDVNVPKPFSAPRPPALNELLVSSEAKEILPQGADLAVSSEQNPDVDLKNETAEDSPVELKKNTPAGKTSNASSDFSGRDTIRKALDEAVGSLEPVTVEKKAAAKAEISVPVPEKTVREIPLAMPQQLPVAKSEEENPVKPAKPAPSRLEAGEEYVFSSFLHEADAFELKEDAPVIKGVWDKNGFAFPGSAEDSVIRRSSEGTAPSGDKPIFFPGVSGSTRRLVFPAVQASSVLKLSYLVPQAATVQEKSPSIYLRVWVGSYPIKRLNLSASGGWIDEEIDLGVVEFLKEPVPIMFDLSVSGSGVVPISFDIRIEQTA